MEYPRDSSLSLGMTAKLSIFNFPMSLISLIYGNDRYQNVSQALKLIKDEVWQRIKNTRNIVIKPNFVHVDIPLSATHPLAVKACLNFLYTLKPDLKKKEIIIAEGAACGGETEKGFQDYGYYQVLKGYNIRYVDLNHDQSSEYVIASHNLKPIKLKLSKTILNSDFRISISPPKTHDSVIVTLSLKNMAVGSIIVKPKRSKSCPHLRNNIHLNFKETNLILFELAKIIPPDLSIIDGFEAMEGDGPGYGEKVAFKIAMASTDWLACDSLCTYLMGFNPDEIGYLWYAKQAGIGEWYDSKNVRIVGAGDFKKIRKKFKPHPSYKEQLEWR